MVPILVNHSPSRRVGPLELFNRGQYKGQRVEDIIRRNPQYVMYCIKEWLDISPRQALVFERCTGGGIIPDRYIKESPPSEEDDWTQGDRRIYNDNLDVGIPNYDFDPGVAPPWWREFKLRSRDSEVMRHPYKYYSLYESYSKRDLQHNLKSFRNG